MTWLFPIHMPKLITEMNSNLIQNQHGLGGSQAEGYYTTVIINKSAAHILLCKQDLAGHVETT